MGFVKRIKRFLNKTTPGATVTDYGLNEVNLETFTSDVERMATVFNDIYGEIVISGGLEANRTLLLNDLTPCLAYAKKRRIEQDVGVTAHAYTALRDTYVHLDTLTGQYTFNEVTNGSAAPALGAEEITVIKVVTDATQITGTTDLAARTLSTTLTTSAAPNIALLNQAQSFSAAQTFEATAPILSKGLLESEGTGAARIRMTDTFGGVNLKKTDILNAGGLFEVQALNDDGTFRANLLSVDANGVMGSVSVPGALLVDGSITNAELAANAVLGVNVASAQIGSGHLKTASGSAIGTALNGQSINIVMNTYSFFPNVGGEVVRMEMSAHVPQSGPAQTGHFALRNNDTVTRAYNIQWVYVTASDNPTVCVLHNASGEISGVWMSDDPLTKEQGLSSIGFTTLDIPRADLSIMLAGIPLSVIERGRGKSSSKDRDAYRIAHEAFASPAEELRKRCKIVGGKLIAK